MSIAASRTNTDASRSPTQSLAAAATINIVSISSPSLADADQADKQSEAVEVTPMPVPDSPSARRIREIAAQMVADDPGLPQAVALDRADALQTMADEREAMEMLELDQHEGGCDSLEARYGHHDACCARCRRGYPPREYD